MNLLYVMIIIKNQMKYVNITTLSRRKTLLVYFFQFFSLKNFHIIYLALFFFFASLGIKRNPFFNIFTHTLLRLLICDF